MRTLSDQHHANLKRQLERLLHVLLTHSGDRSESKVDFCRRCAWDVECIIDELDRPSVNTGSVEIASVIDECIARRERIHRRQALRGNDDWGPIPVSHEKRAGLVEAP